MKELNDFLLNLFTANDKLRPAMSFPNLKDGIVYASDGHVLIAIPEDELTLKYRSNPKYPNAQKLLDENQKLPNSIKVKVSDISTEVIKARIIVDSLLFDCEECNGSGYVEWEYVDKKDNIHTEDYDCPLCDGKGEKEEAHPFARVSLSMIEDKEDPGRCGISIGDLYFHPFQLYRLFMVALVKGYDSIEIFFDKKKYGTTVTCFGDIKVLIMAMMKG